MVFLNVNEKTYNLEKKKRQISRIRRRSPKGKQLTNEIFKIIRNPKHLSIYLFPCTPNVNGTPSQTLTSSALPKPQSL